MAYCTTTDMIKLIPESMLINLSNDQPNQITIHAVNAAEAIDQADREIDAYLLLAGHDVPIDPIPPLVANLSAKMAIWNLHLRKYFNSEIWEKTYERCIRTLEKIAAGKLSIQMDPDVIEEATASGHAVDTRDQKFTTAFMETY